MLLGRTVDSSPHPNAAHPTFDRVKVRLLPKFSRSRTLIPLCLYTFPSQRLTSSRHSHENGPIDLPLRASNEVLRDRALREVPDTKNNERQVCARREDGEPAVSSPDQWTTFLPPLA